MDNHLEKMLPILFEDQVDRTPNFAALVDESNRFSYAFINESANRLARYLKGLGVGSDALLALHYQRCPEAISVILAVLKVGAAFLPLDVHSPGEYLCAILKKSKSLYLIAPSKKDLPEDIEYDLPAIFIDEIEEKIKKQSSDNLARKVNPSDLAYVIYTSGSTGHPKGVEIEHKGIPNLIRAQVSTFRIDVDSRVLQFAALNFDASISEIFTALLSGARLYFPREEIRSNPKELIAYINRYKISVATIPPTLLIHFPKVKKTALKTLVVAGDTCSKDVMDEWSQYCRVINAYGPTEGTVCSTLFVYDGVSNYCIGSPISGVKVYVLNDKKMPVLPGEMGELYISGLSLARGYRFQADDTNGKFILWSPSESEGDALRLYRTGDKVKLLNNRLLEFQGRIDFGFKFNSIRIEPEEIESFLEEHPSIKQSVVDVKIIEEKKHLVAYIIPVQSGCLSKADVISFLKRKLPMNRVPNIYIFLDKFPILSSGKVNRQRLPVPKLNRVKKKTHGLSEKHIELRKLWATVLGVSENAIGLHTDFFSLGATSLNVTQLSLLIGQKTGINVAPSKIFTNSILCVLAEEIWGKNDDNESLSLLQVGASSNIPPSFSQRRLWLSHQVIREKIPQAYNVKLNLAFNGPLDKSMLIEALQELIDRHEILRTHFSETGDQRVMPFEFSLLERSVEGEAIDRKERVCSIIEECFETSFGDLSMLPLLRGVLIQLSKSKFVLSLVFHHILIDALSIPVLLEELARLYNCCVSKEEENLENLPVQYRHFALWEDARLKRGCFDRAFSYWKKQLGGATGMLDLPTNKTRPQNRSYQGDTHVFYLEKGLLDDLRSFSQVEGVTLFSLLFSLVSTLLYRYRQQEDFLLGVVCGERQHPFLNKLIGFFVNVLPIRVQQSNQLLFKESLVKIHRTLLKAYENNAPLEEIYDKIKVPHHLDAHPLFQATVSFHDSSLMAVDFSNLDVDFWDSAFLMGSHLRSSKFDLEFEMEALRDDRLAVKITYSTDLFVRETIHRMAGYFSQLCKSVITAPDADIASLSFLDEKDQNKLIKSWNKTIPRGHKTILQLFMDQVEKRPDAIAVIDGDHTFTYDSLNKEANRLAHCLKKTTDLTASENIIAVALERSKDFIISILAILKTGSAYLPVSPESPLGRVQFMLDDSEAVLLICEQTRVKKFAKLPISTIPLDSPDLKLNEQPDHEIDAVLIPNQLAYVIYTSGSTGKPKGVMIEHHSVAQLVNNMEYVDLTNNDVMAHVCNVTFDVSGFEIWGALLNGARLVVYPKETVLDPADFKAHLEQDGISVIILTSALFYRLLLIDHNIFSTVKSALYIGEKLMSAKPVKRALKNRLLHISKIINAYGPTEETIIATTCNVKFHDILDDEIPIGKPIRGTSAYILDKNLNPIPANMVGELYLGGYGVARGYLKRALLTQQRFVRNHFAKDGSRLYKTGDLVYQRNDGNIVYIKRMDQQVKFSGYRIELSEIESVILLNKEVKESIVLKTNHEGQEKLVAFVVLRETRGEAQDIAAVREHLKRLVSEKLPVYMVPSDFVLIDKIPLTINGKLDRRSLVGVQKKIRCSTDCVPLLDEQQKKIQKIWKRLLNTDREIGATDNFFLLGGTSLLAMQLVGAISHEFGSVSYTDLFSVPTIESQAKLVQIPSRKRKRWVFGKEFFIKESTLDPDITILDQQCNPYPSDPRAIFLTGVTGFFGVFLLETLLNTTSATIYCLVRARDDRHAEQRFIKTLETYSLSYLIPLMDRIRWVVGDVGKDRLGLSEATYDFLAEKIDIIYHCASEVNFIKPYSAMKNSNVEGTKNMLHFSIRKSVKPLHYISSASVFSFSHYYDKNKLIKEEPLQWSDSLFLALSRDIGYVQSKAIAEMLIWEASSRGIPVVVHRLGFVLCHSKTGIGNEDQLWPLYIKDCLALGACPKFKDVKGEFLTVDYASRAVAYISKQFNCLGRAFHIVPSKEYNLTTDQLFSKVSLNGQHLNPTLFSQWRKKLESYVKAGYDSALALLMPLFTDEVQNNLTLFQVYESSPDFEVGDTLSIVEGSGIVESPIDNIVINKFLSYMVEKPSNVNYTEPVT